MKALINRFSRWYNAQQEDNQVYMFLAFCLLFVALLWFSVSCISFDAQVYHHPLPVHIGKASGLLPDSSTTNK